MNHKDREDYEGSFVIFVVDTMYLWEMMAP